MAATKKMPNEEMDREYRRLLASRCIVEYRYYDDRERLVRWYDVHPLVKDLEKFSQNG